MEPPLLRGPPELADELVEVILLRSPPDDPARLVRAALVCKRWCRLVSEHSFRRRFRSLHRRLAPMLGILRNDAIDGDEAGGYDAGSARLVPTAASCPPLASRRGWHALYARAGRVLLYRPVNAEGIRLAVWDPLAAGDSHHLDLPAPALRRRPRSWDAALLCDDDPDGGPFRVVLVGTDVEGTFVCDYSSPEPAAWSEPAYPPQFPTDEVDDAHGALVGDALYFVCKGETRVLRYDLATRAMSVVHLPPLPVSISSIALITAEGGALGFAMMYGSRLSLWSMEGSTGTLETEWTQDRVFDLGLEMPCADILHGFMHGLGIILIGAADGFYSVDQKSGRIKKLVDGCGFYEAFPFASFYTPALADKGSGANA